VSRFRGQVIVLVAAASVIVGVARAEATMLLQRMSLESVTAEAGRIVHGTVTDVRSGRDERGIPATWVTLDVARTVKGSRVTHLTMKQFGTMEPLADGAIGSVPGLPRYRSGEEVVIFLRTESAHGFTSPVGLQDGVYRVRTEGADRMLRGPDSDARATAPPQKVDAFLDRVETLVRAGK